MAINPRAITYPRLINKLAVPKTQSICILIHLLSDESPL